MAKEPKLPKHHYIPVFYLKQWAPPKAVPGNGRLVEFSAPYNGIVKGQYKYPDATGYVRGLYRIPGLPDDKAELIESRFFKLVDDWASYALAKLNRRHMDDWSAHMRSAWSRFLIALLIRSPKSVAEIKFRLVDGLPEHWERERERLLREDPTSEPLGPFDQLASEQYAALALQRFIDNQNIGNFINAMDWSVLDVGGSKYRFLTSDRPIVMTNGVGVKGGHLAIAISPTNLFLAANDKQTTREIHAYNPLDVVRSYNKQVVRNAIKYVWAHDHSQVALVRAQFSIDSQNDRSFFIPNDRKNVEESDLAKKLVV